MRSHLFALAVLASATPALAQPTTSPEPTPAPPAAPPPPPLATLRDPKQLAETLAQITNDPAIRVTDPAVRATAQALMSEGVRQLQQKNYDQALANFLEAYGQFPSPRLLLDIASTLFEMGRAADAANTYQRYITDPNTTPERLPEVKTLLNKLDTELTILTVRVVPKGSDISIDGGPFVTVGSSLVTRVRPGIHLVRIRNGKLGDEVSINGFDGEDKEVPAAIKMEVSPDAPPPKAPERVDAWLQTGTLYSSDEPPPPDPAKPVKPGDPTPPPTNSNVRHVRSSSTPEGHTVTAILPRAMTDETDVVDHPHVQTASTTYGALGWLRIDGEGRGAAGGVGVAIALREHFEIEGAYLRSHQNGLYVGGRVQVARLVAGTLRPYVAAGLPVFFFNFTDASSMTQSRSGVGVRAAAGLELVVNPHLSVLGDLGYEHFFNVSDTGFESDVFVPTLGVVGRL